MASNILEITSLNLDGLDQNQTNLTKTGLYTLLVVPDPKSVQILKGYKILFLSPYYTLKQPRKQSPGKVLKIV